jgi:hypothetical protein
VNFQTSLRVSSSARTRDTQICYNSKAEGWIKQPINKQTSQSTNTTQHNTTLSQSCVRKTQENMWKLCFITFNCLRKSFGVFAEVLRVFILRTVAVCGRNSQMLIGTLESNLWLDECGLNQERL